MLNGNGMIYRKDHKQMDITDPWFQISPKRRRRLENDWPGLFQEEILPELPVEKFAENFCDDNGAPTKELTTILGALLIQHMKDLTDKEAIDQLAFNAQWHYALNIPEESDGIKYVSDKTWWSMRQRATQNNLDEVMLDLVAAKLAKVFKVNTENQRIDSVHIKSNMRKLGRLSIFSQTIHRFLINLQRHYPVRFKTIDTTVSERYFTKKALGIFAMVKPSQSTRDLATVSSDLYDLIEQFKDQPAVCNMTTYKAMQRVLSEQCHIHTDGGSRVTVKPPKEVSPDSLQNPSDPDATYSGHKGQGYQVQIMETYTPTKEADEDDSEKESRLNLITHVSVEKACEHDKHALLPAIKETDKKGLKPETILADSLYGCDNNVTQAEKEDVTVTAPAMKSGTTKKVTVSDFRFDDDGRVTHCPGGHTPDKTKHKKKNGRYSASFSLHHCRECPNIKQCPVQSGKKFYYLRYGGKDLRLARRRKYEATDEFKDCYRWRAGVEATMSQLDRLTGIKHQRVRGLPKIRFSSVMKAAGVNILRATAVRKAIREKHKAALALLKAPFPFFKERILAFLPKSNQIYYRRLIYADSYVKLAA